MDETNNPHQKRNGHDAGDPRLSQPEGSGRDPDFALAAEELYFKENIIKYSATAIATCDMDGKMTYANPYFHRLWGFDSDDDFLGKPFCELWLLGDQKEDVICIIHAEGTWSGELKARRKDGTLFDVQVTAARVLDSRGTPIALTSTSIDITARKQAEEKLRTSEKKLSTLFKSMTEVVVLHEMVFDDAGRPSDYRILDCNNAFSGATGISRDRACGRLATEVYETDVPPYLEEYNTVIRTKCSTRFEIYSAPMAKYFDISAVFVEGNTFATVSSDVTEYRRAQQDLEASEKRYKTLFADSPDAYMIIVDGVFVECNHAAERMLGGERDMIVGKSPDLISPEFQADGTASKDAAREKIAAAFDSGTQRFEWIHRCFDGYDFPVEVSLSVMSFAGKPALFTSLRDIAERKRSEELRMQANERLRVVMNSMPAFIYIADMQTHELLFVNEYARAVWGADIKGKKCWDALQGLDGPCPFCTNDKLLDSEGRPAGVYQWEFHNTLHGRWYDLRDCAIQWTDGRFVRMEIATDITESKIAQEKFKQEATRKLHEVELIAQVAGSPALVAGDVETLAKEATEASSRALQVERVGVWLFDDSQTVLQNVATYCASEKRHVCGDALHEDEFFNEFAVLKKHQFIDAHDALNDPRTAGYVERYLKPHRITSMLDAVIRSGEKNIGVVCFEHVDTPHRWEDDEIAFACQVADHIALVISHRERKKIEAELDAYRTHLEELVEDRTRKLRQAQERLIFSEKFAALGKLAGMVAHELRNPLGVIRNAVVFLRLRLSGQIDEKVKKHLEILDAEVVLADRIINDILAYGRIKKPELVCVDLNQLIAKVLQKTQLPDQIQLETDLAPGLSKPLVDENQFALLLNNIILNAVEAMPSGGLLRIWTSQIKDSFMIHIVDTGVGIAVEKLPKIFDPDFSDKPTGIGLGLAICQSIVNLHNGHIDVRSEEQKGTEFIITLPK